MTKKKPMEAKETIGDGGGRKYANSQFSDQNRQDAISRVSAVQNSAKGPRWEHWRSSGRNTRSHQQCRLRRNGNDGYRCPPLHLKAPVWQHARCTKAKKQAQVCHPGRRKEHEYAVATWRKTCSKEELAEKAQGIEATIPVKKSQEARYKLNPGSFLENCFWGKRPDGVAINEDLQIVYILEIFEQINIVVGNHGSVVESDFYTKLKSLICKKGNKTSSSPIMWHRYAKPVER